MRLTTLSSVFLAFCVCLPSQAAEPLATLVRRSGIQGGVIVHVGCGDGQSTATLCVNDACVVQGLDVDRTLVERASKRFQSLGLGGRVSATTFDGRRLPYTDNLVNVLILSKDYDITRDEAIRVLAPGGRLLSIAPASLAEQPIVKPWPKDVDTWTHFLHGPDNNPVSHDMLVASPRRLQWISNPTYGRHHNYLASLSAMVTSNGRLFSIEDHGPAASINLPADWRLIARDAFNGVTLWERPIQKWQSTKTGFRSGPVQLPRRLVAIGDRVYVALNLGDPLRCLDAATGKTLQTYQKTDGVDEILYLNGTLFLAATDNNDSGTRRILAVDARSGNVLWQNSDGPASHVLAGSLTVGRERLFFHDGRAVVAIDRQNGQPLWRTEVPSIEKRPSWLPPTVIFHDGVVLCGDRAVDYPESWKQHAELISGMLAHGGLAHLTAFSADEGKTLWETEASESFHGAVDVFVIDDLVWASNGPARFFYERTRPILAEELGSDFYIEHVIGRALRTGNVEKTLDADAAFTLAHHHRCFRDKATDRFIIMGRTGIDMISLDGSQSLRHNWTRGMCQYGVMPANGLLYTPPHPCACYNASKLNGFFAYSSRKEAGWDSTIQNRLETGPAFDSVQSTDTARQADWDQDWPTFRHDNARSGCGAALIGDRPALAWSRKLSGKLSAPTSAAGMVFVSDIEHHTVNALDIASGKTAWTHIAGGRVDSPPTYWKGRLYFGAADGTITCLTAADGVLVWRYLAAPQKMSIVAWNQLESAWPIAGSVIVRDGSVFALAGRSSNIDGGMTFIRLDATTGQVEQTRTIYTRDPETGRQSVDDVDDLYLAGLLYDIPSCDADSLFVREARLSLDGKMLKDSKPHIYSVGGFLDDTLWHRFYMLYGTRFKNGPGSEFGRSGGAPSGRLLVCDDRHVFGYGALNRTRHHLFCVKKNASTESTLGQTAAGRQQRKSGPRDSATVWSNDKFPIMPQAMLLTRSGEANASAPHRFVVAGPAATALTRLEVLRGEEGGLLMLVDAATGKTISQTSLESPPIFDGLCAARGYLIMSQTSGVIAAFK